MTRRAAILSILLSVPLASRVAAENATDAKPADSKTAPAASSGQAGAAPGAPVAEPAAVEKAKPPELPFEVDKLAFATEVSSMTPVAPTDAFDSGTRSVFFWNRLLVKHPPVQVRHVWYHGDEKVADYPLTLRYNRTRIWTSKRVKPGQWRVDITDGQGNPIATGSFIVRQ
ncbi:MAG: DUF2914 domain-containing protein [Elusimicrobia bacterium]|nr:DUF2914 domain-containing protein [Elusimicrobiota bacterium]